MFIPKRCRDIAGWTEKYNPNSAGPIDMLVTIIRGYNRRHYVYRCEKCGYESDYDDYPEQLRP